MPAVAGRLHRALKHKEGVPIDLKVPMLSTSLSQHLNSVIYIYFLWRRSIRHIVSYCLLCRVLQLEMA